MLYDGGHDGYYILFQKSKNMLRVVLGMYVICYPINISLLVI
jgi:multisubunit Na+/H+ antiporter MnhC subunit